MEHQGLASFYCPFLGHIIRWLYVLSAGASGVPHALAHHTLPPHGGQRWRAQLCWQHKKHEHVLEQACRSANPSRWSSTTNGSLGGSLRHLPPTVSRAY